MMLRRMSGLVLAILVIAAYAFGQDGEARVRVKPESAREVVINPGKGWVLYGQATGHSDSLLAVSNLGYRRFEWADLEPEEGRFQWEPIESFLAGWDRLGKQAAFGVMCLNSHTSKPDGYSTPKWVFDAGAPRRIVELKDIQQQTTGIPGLKVVPTFNDPVFLAKLANLLAALGRRFDGDRRIAFVDMRSYGNWGEGHMHPFGGAPISAEEFRHHVQLHLDAFPKTRICISCENQETLRAFGIAPAVVELFGPYGFLKEQEWWYGRDKQNRQGYGHRLEDCVEIGKPSYIDLSRGGKSGRELLEEEPELVRRLANRMGYHFVLQEAVYPRRISRTKSATAAVQWFNAGVAPIYVPCLVAFGLLDAEGRVAAKDWPPDCEPQRWQPGETVTETITPQFADAPAGSYRLAVGLFADREAKVPWIRLAIDGETVQGWHVLGPVTLEP